MTSDSVNKHSTVFFQNEHDNGSNLGLSKDDMLLADCRNLDDPALDETVDLPAELPPPPDGGWGKHVKNFLIIVKAALG